jgi:hypothetical protein
MQLQQVQKQRKSRKVYPYHLNMRFTDRHFEILSQFAVDGKRLPDVMRQAIEEFGDRHGSSEVRRSTV